ncbi:MAG TPA: F0F1 ATP synthase subunit alpha, partial [Desulfomicrobiaceae bacterium]|nr:F0F1 ATP synthase subunit alpha [Desulfomicrobiaceae bacterium]
VEEQVASLYAGTRGYLDEYPVEQAGRFDSELLDFMRNQKDDVLAEIRDTAQLGADTEKKLAAAIEEFKAGFKA